MKTLTVLYTRPETDAEAFVEEYRRDHLPIAARFPGVTSSTTTVFSGTPRGGDAPYVLMFHATWHDDDAFAAAMRDPSMMEASKHAMQMIGTYGNSAEMLLGDA